MNRTPLPPLLHSVAKSAEFQQLIQGLQSDQSRTTASLPEPAMGYLIATMWQTLSVPTLVLVPRPEAVKRLSDQLFFWLGSDAPIYPFGEIDTVPYEHITRDVFGVYDRMRALAAFNGHGTELSGPALVVSSAASTSQKVVNASVFREAIHTIRSGDKISIDDLASRWISMGYSFEHVVESPGMASRRGGILDVYTPSMSLPVRIEFFGNNVESIRVFDPTTQRSTVECESATIVPAQDILPGLSDPKSIDRWIEDMDFSSATDDSSRRIKEDLNLIKSGEIPSGISFYGGLVNDDSLIDYLPEDGLLITLRMSEFEDVCKQADKRRIRIREIKETRGDIPNGMPSPSICWDSISSFINRWPRTLRVSPWDVDVGVHGGIPRLPFSPISVPLPESDQFWQDLKSSQNNLVKTVLISQHSTRLVEIAREHCLDAHASDNLDVVPEKHSLTIITGSLRRGFRWKPNIGDELLVFTDAEIFGITRERRPNRKTPVVRGVRIQDLRKGSFVVHIEHGIGRFSGTVYLEGDAREYLLIEYADSDKLYVPMEQLNRLAPYHGSRESTPRLTRLGSQEWAKAKARARRATEQLAGELIALYAERELTLGLGTGIDTPWQDQFEASFPYEETEDQVRVLGEVKADLEKTVPMDRLICGDVGYGKTEIAVRAAFKVVQSGRQVAILVPTTVLAQQHIETFKERLAGFPVTVAGLSRLVNTSDQRAVVAGLMSGAVDIVIGTHRLLQKDVSFKNLGLVVIDEEHRFGVVHKEQLKRMRRDVDVMTMSATPIPRTLHISLAGVRDMSTIDTPPEDRRPIQTYVSEDSSNLVREAILREIDRDGQIFFVHNRVKTIDSFANRLSKLVPEASIGIGHGQMSETDLDLVMADFTAGKFDILLSTTIIESGLDLPNVNTLIVDRADRFGLSQLYQLRGRVGRGSRRAYAYFIVPRGKRMTDAAEQRLNTIIEASELGAGYQIAMRDMEIRGAGNILGAEQSGNITAVGFDLYTKLLNKAVLDLKSGSDDKITTVTKDNFSLLKVDIGIDASIPYTYVESLAERLSLYQRIARFVGMDEVDEIETELRDRFGPLPIPAQALLFSIKVRILADQAGLSSVTSGPDRIVLTLREPTGDAKPALASILGTAVTVGHMQVRFTIDRRDEEWRKILVTIIKKITTFRKRMLGVLDRAAVISESA